MKRFCTLSDPTRFDPLLGHTGGRSSRVLQPPEMQAVYNFVRRPTPTERRLSAV